MACFRCFVLACIIAVYSAFPVWAFPYPSNDALYDSEGFAKQVDFYSLESASNAFTTLEGRNDIEVQSSVGSVDNTIDFSGCSLQFDYTDGTSLTSYPISLAGTFSFVVPEGKTVQDIVLYLNTVSSLPVGGKYYVQVDFSSDSSLSYNRVYNWMHWTSKNQAANDASYNITSLRQSSGDLYFNYVLTLQSNLQYFSYIFYLKDYVSTGGAIGGKFSISFSSTSSQADVISPGTAPSSDDIQSSISSSTSQIASGVNDVYQSILALTQHISNQLFAFWDQLYNLIHVPTYNKLNEILRAIQAIQVKVNVDVSSVVDSVNDASENITNSVTDASNTISSTVSNVVNNQISNDNRNTEDLKNGYDNSSLTSDNDKLNNSINSYDDVESGLIDDSKKNIEDFEFQNPFADYSAVLTDISYFLAGIYSGLGSLNIPVGFSLTLSIALIFIGYYRFKGGR